MANVVVVHLSIWHSCNISTWCPLLLKGFQNFRWQISSNSIASNATDAKLLHMIITSLRLADLKTYPHRQNIRVWALDSNFTYSHHKYVLLLLVTIPCFLFLWMPYTVILFSMQWLRKIDHYKPLKSLAQYKTIHDAYNGPLKDKQRSLLVWGTSFSTRNTSCVIPHFKPIVPIQVQFASVADLILLYPFALLPQSCQDL